MSRCACWVSSRSSSHALGDVARVEHDARDVPVVAEIGDVGLEMAPLALRVAHPQDESRRLAFLLHHLQHGTVVVMDEAREAIAEQLRLRAAERARDRRADVAAATGQDDHEVGRVADEAAEMLGLAARGGDQRPCEQERDQEPSDAERDEDLDQPGDVLVVARCHRPRRAQGDVRGQRGEDAQPLHGIRRRDLLVRRQRDERHISAREGGAAGRDEIADKPLLLLQLAAHDAVGRAREVRSSSSPLTPGARPPSSSAFALAASTPAVCAGSACSPARTRSTSWT